MKRQRLITALCMALLFAFLILLVFLRTQLVDRQIGSYIACKGCFDSSVVLSDLMLFGLAAGVLLLASLVRPDWLARLVQSLFAFVILIYITDLIVFDLFHSRLFLSDFALFIAERSAVWDQFYTGMGGGVRPFALLGGLLIPFVLLAMMPPVRAKSDRLLLTAMLGISLTAGMVRDPKSYVNEWAVDNVFAANLATTERVRYSDAKAADILAARKPPVQVSIASPEAVDESRNVILVIVESWSPWHSKLFGGYEDWTPHLDSAAAGGMRFPNFHSIGFSTNKGLMGILGGMQLWSPFLHPLKPRPFIPPGACGAPCPPCSRVTVTRQLFLRQVH